MNPDKNLSDAKDLIKDIRFRYYAPNDQLRGEILLHEANAYLADETEGKAMKVADSLIKALKKDLPQYGFEINTIQTNGYKIDIPPPHTLIEITAPATLSTDTKKDLIDFSAKTIVALANTIGVATEGILRRVNFRKLAAELNPSIIAIRDTDIGILRSHVTRLSPDIGRTSW